jgi:hypothetical protein
MPSKKTAAAVEAAPPVEKKPRRAPAPKPPATTREVRDWAIGKGLTDKTRGRLSPKICEAFTKANKREIVRVVR